MLSNEEKKIRYYSQNLINNEIAPKNIPFELVSEIIEYLASRKNPAIERGQVEKLKSIQQALNDLERYKEEMEAKIAKQKLIEQMNSQYRKCLPKINNPKDDGPEYSEQELDDMLESLVNGYETDPDVRIIPELVVYTKSRIEHLVQNDDLLNAQRYEHVYQQLLSYNNNSSYYESQDVKRKKYQSQLDRAKDALKQAQDKMESDLEAYDKRAKEIHDAQQLEWEKTLDNFDKTTNDELPEKYKKFSQKLLSLREQSQNLIKLRQYEQAGLMRIEADELEQYELMKLRQKYESARKIQRNNLVESHKQKMECFEENGSRIRQRIYNDSQTKIDSLERTINHLEQKIQKLNSIIPEGITIKTPSHTPQPTRPLTRQMSTDHTFVTQQSSNGTSRINGHSPKKNIKAVPSPIKYRPIPSRWRIQNPQYMKTYIRD